ncbi:MAG: hypothetical protein OEU92_04655, partial [Alphaproteobacteria bacterium]|nr:hypothetical protein [Alphaproteobacteria bacterium]
MLIDTLHVPMRIRAMKQSDGKPQNDGGRGNGGNQNNAMWLWLAAGSLFLFMAMSMQSPPSARYERLA